MIILTLAAFALGLIVGLMIAAVMAVARDDDEVPRPIDPEQLGRAGLEFDSAGFAPVWLECSEEGRKNIADLMDMDPVCFHDGWTVESIKTLSKPCEWGTYWTGKPRARDLR